jgi:hypothetical protein
MNDTVSVDFQFSIKPQGRGARKRMVEKTSSSEDTKPLERILRIARYMALAIHFEGLIRQGVVTDFADLARLGHVTRARVTQIMNLRLLAPEIQEDILLLESSGYLDQRIQLQLLQSIVSVIDWKQQRVLWTEMTTKKSRLQS